MKYVFIHKCKIILVFIFIFRVFHSSSCFFCLFFVSPKQHSKYINADNNSTSSLLLWNNFLVHLFSALFIFVSRRHHTSCRACCAHHCLFLHYYYITDVFNKKQKPINHIYIIIDSIATKINCFLLLFFFF